MIRRIAGMLPAWVLSAVVLVGVLWLTLAPHPVGEVHVELFKGADKVVHALMMGTLTAALLYDLYRHTKQRPKTSAAVWVFIAVAMFSAIDEWAQGAMHLGRTSDPYDLLADLCGAGIVTLIYLFLHRYRRNTNDR